MQRSICLSCAIFLFAQFCAFCTDQPPATTFKGQSNLVLIPTVVHDKSGAHIPSLTKDDFAVTSDGDKRTISVFEEVRPGNQRIQRPPAQPGQFTNIVNGQLQPGRVTIIALDTVSTAALRQATAREHLIKVLADTIQPDSMIAVLLITTTGTQVIHDFTADPHILLQSLKAVIAHKGIAHPATMDLDQQSPTYGGKTTAMGADAVDPRTQQILISRFWRGEFQKRSLALERKVAAYYELDALDQIGHAMSGLPGRKSLIWVGDPFPFTLYDNAIGQDPPDLKSVGGRIQSPPQPNLQQFLSMLPVYQRVWKSLNDANIAIYAIDMRGLTTSVVSASEEYKIPNDVVRERWSQWDSQDTYRIFADVTGGKSYTNTNDFDKAYRDSMNDTAAYYLVGYYIDRKKDKVGWHDLAVKVNRPGADVRSRRGFYLQKSDDKSSNENEIDVALRSPLDYSGLPLMGQMLGQSGSGAKRKVSFAIMLPIGVGLIDETDNNHLNLEIFVRALTANGSAAAHDGQQMEGHLTDAVVAKAKQEGIRYESRLELSPGTYTVRFVVRDRNSGRIGSVSTPVRVGDDSPAAAK
jgi:VWFA-related protein